jgi:CHAT domain-containing protein/tetratricopeptide (TPR) repeat protein
MGARMFGASLKLMMAGVVLAFALVMPACAQGGPDIAALNRQVRQLYDGGKFAEATPLAEQALAQAEAALGKDDPETLTAVKNLAEIYDDQGRHDAAEPLFTRALEGRERVLGAEHPDTLVSVNNLAVFYQSRGRTDDAEPLFKRALAARERVLGADHQETLQSAENLALLYDALHRDTEAEPLFRHTLEAQTRVLGPDAPDTLATVNDLAHFYQSRARLAEAEPLLKRVLDFNDRTSSRDNPASLLIVGTLARFYLEELRFTEAEPLLTRILPVFEGTLGPGDPRTLEVIDGLVNIYRIQGRNGAAEPLLKRLVETRERTLGKEHADTLGTVDQLADLYVAEGRLTDAEPLAQSTLAQRERNLGAEHPDTLRSVNRLAEIFRGLGHFSEAEALYKRVLEARQRLLGSDHRDTLATLDGIAQLYIEQGRDDEAEPILKRALEAEERTLGKDDPLTIAGVNNLASLYFAQERYAEAEPLYRRAVETLERISGKDSPNTLGRLINLSGVYQQEGRYGEAEALYLRALEGYERVRGKDHPETLVSVNNLARLYRVQNRLDEAERLYKRALDGFERVLGKDHPDTLSSISNLAELYSQQGRYGEAETLLLGALSTGERVFGAESPRFGVLLGNLAQVRFLQSDWPGAAQYLRRAAAGIIARTQRGAQESGLTGRVQSEAEHRSGQFVDLVKALYRVSTAPSDQTAREAFIAAQWALNSEAAQSLAQMAARGAKGDPALAALARERQDLLAEWKNRDSARNAALGEAADRRDAKAEADNLARLAAIDQRIAAIDRQLAVDYPDYAALANPAPVSIEELQGKLGADEALVLFLDTPEERPTPEETFIWVVTKTALRWVHSDLGTAALAREVQALRCGLDEEEWATPTSAARCGNLLDLTEVPETSRPLPFHLGKAYALYKALFGRVEDMTAGKRLLIVPSGALTSLPFHVLVTKAPKVPLPANFAGYRSARWFGKRNAMVVLPAVSSVKALRQHASGGSAPAGAYAGYGDPALKGDGASCRPIRSPAECPPVDGIRQRGLSVLRAIVGGGGGGRRSVNATMDEVFANGRAAASLREQVRLLCPLPDTAYEIKCVAARFKSEAPLIRLEGAANEADLKARSESGQLAHYGILHFATHGLLSGDVERMAKRQGEPALVLTPPLHPANADDDGLLMASEVAALKLNASWVVLSACNTAAGDKMGAQALSGLARAFFYAGGRSLLVSHWPVYSDAAVRLTTRAFAELERHPKAGRAEALQRAMIDLMEDRSQADNAHPAVWAPFVVVGEGGR